MDRKVTIVSSCESKRGGFVHNKEYGDKAVRLAYSIRTNGGKYKDSDIIMWYADDAAPGSHIIHKLQRLGCKVVCGTTYLEDEPIANKIEASCIDVDSEYVLWMDSDMYVLDAAGFEQLFSCGTDFAAVTSAFGHHKWATFDDMGTWRSFYELLGIAPPQETFITGLDRKECVFYFNSALVLFKTGFSFAQIWKDIARKVRYSGIKDAEKNFTQTSLTLTVLKTGCSYTVLPASYNAYYALQKEKSFEGIILHYQDNVIDNNKKVLWDISNV